ncbi:hypothetical protein [Clostridium cylindrosporum]|uniref:Uncharacterized protein n=1 Tax=Clostridium cylindrosporum DSM 605 TaxID=1121307 RepID=A0A0J8DBZ2_CLOCY|nr:hypothetical protein [Clostridium cylindrosporum]KMT21819.1 hypothetical protein CLCY_3c00860 [Clostridium cylindrosporum DSM 605]
MDFDINDHNDIEKFLKIYRKCVDNQLQLGIENCRITALVDSNDLEKLIRIYREIVDRQVQLKINNYKVSDINEVLINYTFYTYNESIGKRIANNMSYMYNTSSNIVYIFNYTKSGVEVIVGLENNYILKNEEPYKDISYIKNRITDFNSVSGFIGNDSANYTSQDLSGFTGFFNKVDDYNYMVIFILEPLTQRYIEHKICELEHLRDKLFPFKAYQINFLDQLGLDKTELIDIDLTVGSIDGTSLTSTNGSTSTTQGFTPDENPLNQDKYKEATERFKKEKKKLKNKYKKYKDKNINKYKEYKDKYDAKVKDKPQPPILTRILGDNTSLSDGIRTDITRAVSIEKSFTIANRNTLTKGTMTSFERIKISKIIDLLDKEIERLQNINSYGAWTLGAYILSEAEDIQYLSNILYKNSIEECYPVQEVNYNIWYENLNGLYNYLTNFMNPYFNLRNLNTYEGLMSNIITYTSSLGTNDLEAFLSK